MKEAVIRIPERAEPVACDECSCEFSATGPTGYRGDQPVCDRCLFDLAPQLGMVLVLVSITRSFGQLSRRAGDAAAGELVTFARVYETFAAKHGPRREAPLPMPGEHSGSG